MNNAWRADHSNGCKFGVIDGASTLVAMYAKYGSIGIVNPMHEPVWMGFASLVHNSW
jgi:hypothetical protein